MYLTDSIGGKKMQRKRVTIDIQNQQESNCLKKLKWNSCILYITYLTVRIL